MIYEDTPNARPVEQNIRVLVVTPAVLRFL